jgi:hypothetical protein
MVTPTKTITMTMRTAILAAIPALANWSRSVPGPEYKVNSPHTIHSHLLRFYSVYSVNKLSNLYLCYVSKNILLSHSTNHVITELIYSMYYNNYMHYKLLYN